MIICTVYTFAVFKQVGAVEVTEKGKRLFPEERQGKMKLP